MNRENSGFDSYGMRPATLQERLENIQWGLAQLGGKNTPKTATEQALYDELLRRQKCLSDEIAKDLAEEQFVKDVPF